MKQIMFPGETAYYAGVELRCVVPVNIQKDNARKHCADRCQLCFFHQQNSLMLCNMIRCDHRERVDDTDVVFMPKKALYQGKPRMIMCTFWQVIIPLKLRRVATVIWPVSIGNKTKTLRAYKDKEDNYNKNLEK